MAVPIPLLAYEIFTRRVAYFSEYSLLFFLFAFPPVFSFQTALLKSLHLKHWSPSVPWCETLYSINSARSLQGNIEHLFWIAMFLPQQYHSVGLGFDFLLKHDEQLQSKRWGNSAIMFFFCFCFYNVFCCSYQIVNWSNFFMQPPHPYNVIKFNVSLCFKDMSVHG